MSIRVRADRLSKRFYLLNSRPTTLGTIRALTRGEAHRREHWVLKDITLQVNSGDKVALIGRNGSGKTTLLRILTGIYGKTSGKLLVTGDPRPLFAFSAGMWRELSVVDNLYLFGAVHGMSRGRLQPLERSLLDRTELVHLAHNPLKDLSVGQVQRLALAVFSETPSDFLILDEVIRNVDLGFRLEFEEYVAALARSHKTLIMTSHEASWLRRYCQQAIWIEAGRVRRFGPAEDVINEYEASLREVNTTPEAPAAARI